MPNEELITLWNEILSFKITEDNLKKPEENFVFKALINLLQLFNYNTQLMLEEANTEDHDLKRRFKVKFCKIVEKLYKVSDKSHTFVYYDLIRPTPKKTVHLFNSLLNYHLFCNMFRRDIFSKVDEKLNEFEEISKIKASNQLENKEVENKANMIAQKLCEYDETLPKLDEKIAILMSKKQMCDEKIEKHEELLKNYEDLILELQTKEEKLRSEVVPKDEADNLLLKKTSLETSIKEQKEIEQITRENNQERYLSLQKLEKDLKCIETILETYCKNSNDFTSSKDLKPKMNKLLNDLKDQQTKNEKINDEIEMLNEKIIKLENEIKEKNISFNESFTGYEKELLEKIEFKKETQNMINHLNQAIHKIDNEISVQKNNRNFMLKSSEKMYELFVNTIPELRK